jgi:probable F420-dependent oxidoreductase
MLTTGRELRPFRFMATLPSPAPSGDWAGPLGVLAEVGFDTVAVADHFTGGWELEPLVALAVASQHHSTLRFQTNVLSNDYRHPLLLHRMAATLDLLSGGRLEIGIGAGWMRSDYESAGIPFDRAGIRVDRLVESIEVLKGLFSGEPFTFDGRYYTIRNLTGSPAPYQKPYPPLFIGGGSKRILALAGREADIVGLHANLGSGTINSDVVAEMTPERVEEKRSWVEEGAAAAGRDIADLELHMNVRFCRVTATEDDARSFTQKVANTWGVQPEVIASSPSALIGTVSDCAQKLLDRRQSLGVSYIHFDPHPVDPGTWDRIPQVIEAARRFDRRTHQSRPETGNTR